MVAVWDWGWDWVHIHSCGHGHLGFRPYGESLGRAPSNQGLLPLTFGASPRLGMPSLRSCSVGPPRWAIHGPARLNRHPCRFTHCAEPPLGLSRGQENQKPDQDQRPKRGSLKADLITGLSPPPCGSQPAGSHRELGVSAKIMSAAAPITCNPSPYKNTLAHTRPSPLIRPSVSSPSAFDLDLPAPISGG